MIDGYYAIRGLNHDGQPEGGAIADLMLMEGAPL